MYKDDVEMLDSKCLGDYGLTSATARAQAPATVGLACRLDSEGLFYLFSLIFSVNHEVFGVFIEYINNFFQVEILKRLK